MSIEFLVSSDEVKLNEISQFEIGVNICNDMSSDQPFDLSKTKLFVNGERSIAWDLTVQNGTIVNLKIPANKSDTIFWPMGDGLFERSGEYELKLIWESTVQKKKVVVL